MIFLHIKGNLSVAIQALTDREIPPVAIVTVDRGSWGFYTDANVDDKHLSKVIDWYCEPPSETPFPLGTLLGYSEKHE